MTIVFNRSNELKKKGSAVVVAAIYWLLAKKTIVGPFRTKKKDILYKNINNHYVTLLHRSALGVLFSDLFYGLLTNDSSYLDLFLSDV